MKPKKIGQKTAGSLTAIDIRKRALISALEKSLGVVTTACKEVGVSRETYYKYLRQDDDFRERVEDIQDIVLDFAESSLHNQIAEGNTAATIFYLKTKGRKRGYIERHDIGIESEGGVVVHLLPPDFVADEKNTEDVDSEIE